MSIKRFHETANGFVLPLVVLLGMLAFGAGCISPKGDTGDERRAEITKKNSSILEQVYSSYGSAREQVSKSKGYATFSSVDAKILIAGTGNGYGMLTNSSSKAVTYMRMAKLQLGLGAGVQQLSLLFIFKSDKTLNEFLTKGWTFGGGASAALQGKEQGLGDKSVQTTVDQDPLVYQVTDAGVNLSATVSGIKFTKDASLN